VEALAKELPEHLRPILWFGFYTGWRKGEVLPLEWSQVDFQAGEVRLWDSKNDEGRTFPFHVLPHLAEIMEAQRERTRALERKTGTIIPWVFHCHGRPIKSMDGAWRAACERAGFKGWFFHDLRRSAVRELEAAGVSRSTAMSFTGHKTESIYKRYAITDRASQVEGVEKLARHHAGPQEARTVIPMKEAAKG
jgi:integrase